MTTARNFADDIRQLLANDPALNEKVEEAALSAHIAQIVYDARTAAGMTQSELAQLAGTRQSAICRVEDADAPRGHSIFTLRRIAKALGKELSIQFVAPRLTDSEERMPSIAPDITTT